MTPYDVRDLGLLTLNQVMGFLRDCTKPLRDPILIYVCDTFSVILLFLTENFSKNSIFKIGPYANKLAYSLTPGRWGGNFKTGIVLCMRPANERWWYNVTSLIGWVHTRKWSLKNCNLLTQENTTEHLWWGVNTGSGNSLNWCHQATSHYLSQFWLRSVSPCGGSLGPQLVKMYMYYKWIVNIVMDLWF